MKKDYPERLPLSEVWHHFQAGGFAHFSTLDGDQPRVRMMALTAHDQRLWLVTRSSDDKVVQISKNPQAEFTYAIPGTERTGCLRATVEAFIEENQGIRDDVASAIPWFTNYWESSQDTDFTLIRLDLKQIFSDHHERSSKYTIDL